MAVTGQTVGAGRQLTLRDHWEVAVRRRLLIVACVAVCLGGAAILCAVLPKIYRSSTLILVEGQKIPERYVEGVMTGTMQERLSLIQQQVMSRSVLGAVIQDFNLYPDQMRTSAVEAVIERMRGDIKIETKGQGRGQVEAFAISFAHENPVIAMKVTARLASQFIEENLRIREQFVEGASEFLDQELRAAKASLEEREEAISEFKRKFMGELPGQLEANLRALDRLQTEVTVIHESMNSTNDRLSMMEKAVGEYETTGAAPSGVSANQAGVDPLLLRLKELERTLMALQAEYKDTYPDVIHVKQEIEEVKAQLGKRYGSTDRDQEGRGDEGKTGVNQPNDPFLHGLKRQRNELRLELESLRDRSRRLLAQIREYEGRVERTPAREQELMILVRDYDNLQKNYQSLLDKKLNARVAENLEKRQKGEQFRILDPANVPQTPEKPDRLRIMLIGLLAGCGLGYGTAFALETLHQSFKRPEEVEEFLRYPVLAVIPDFRLEYAPGLAARPGCSDIKMLPELLEPKPARQSGRSPFAKRLLAWPPGRSAKGVEPRMNLVSRWRPLSVIAEQFRVAATKMTLLHSQVERPIVVVTSAVQGEGKSATSVNLGCIFAQDLRKMVLLVDADLLNPTIDSYMVVESEPGLTDLLELCARRRGTEPIPTLDQYLRRMDGLPLWILPTGRRIERSGGLAILQFLSSVLQELRGRFDYIIVDAPPILPLATMNVLAEIADLLTLVVRAGATPRDTVQKALKTLSPKIPVGIILNGLVQEAMPYYMRTYYEKKLSDTVLTRTP